MCGMKMLKPKLIKTKPWKFERVNVQRPKQTSDEAKRRKKLYSLTRWRQLRAWHIRHNPLCAECARLGLVTPAEVVDHIRGHRDPGWEARFFDAANLQSLCHPCHAVKTAIETGWGGYRRIESRPSPTPNPPPSRHRTGPR